MSSAVPVWLPYSTRAGTLTPGTAGRRDARHTSAPSSTARSKPASLAITPLSRTVLFFKKKQSSWGLVGQRWGTQARLKGTKEA